MGRIGVELVSNITPRANGPTSIGSFVTRESGKPTQEARQMMAAITAGAASRRTRHWRPIDW